MTVPCTLPCLLTPDRFRKKWMFAGSFLDAILIGDDGTGGRRDSSEAGFLGDDQGVAGGVNPYE